MELVQAVKDEARNKTYTKEGIPLKDISRSVTLQIELNTYNEIWTSTY